MPSKEAYDANLHERLSELRKGDPAYELHSLVFMEAFVYAANLHSDKLPQNILDYGCGLGFMTAWLAGFNENLVGIDVSKKAIEIAKAEHSGIPFYEIDKKPFSEMMPELGIEPFDQVILNMVLHSVDDDTVFKILKDVKKCLKPEGTIHILVPNNEWVIYKLIDYAQDQGMERDNGGIAWVKNKLKKQAVEIPIKINGGEYYPEPITVYQRSIDDYGRMLTKSGFGVNRESYDGKSKKLIGKNRTPFVELNELQISHMELLTRDRVLLMSFSLVE